MDVAGLLAPWFSADEIVVLPAAMSLQAEDEAVALRHLGNSTHFHSARLPRHTGTSAESRYFQPHTAHATTATAIAHSLRAMGRLRTTEDDNWAHLASLMADLDDLGAVREAGVGTGIGHQDMSYEALANLEDVKLTAPPELLATMPLDMCLRGGPWQDKVGRPLNKMHFALDMLCKKHRSARSVVSTHCTPTSMALLQPLLCKVSSSSENPLGVNRARHDQRS